MCLSGLNNTRNDVRVNVLPCFVAHKSDLAHCPTRLISNTLRRHHKCSCSLVLFLPEKLAGAVKNDGDRHLEKSNGRQGDQITKVF